VNEMLRHHEIQQCVDDVNQQVSDEHNRTYHHHHHHHHHAYTHTHTHTLLFTTVVSEPVCHNSNIHPP